MKRTTITNLLSSLVVIICLISTSFFQGCQKDNFQEQDKVDKSIANSPELEDYIIAASDLEHSMNVFQIEINKVDFLNLEITKDEQGRSVRYLPEIIRNLHIEDKVQTMNQKKEELHIKYPQFASLAVGEINEYINYCVKNSVRVNSSFLEMGINIMQPLTKSYSEFFNSEDQQMSTLSEWVKKWWSYVEAVVVIFKDGTREMYVDDLNTIYECRVDISTEDNIHYYRNGKEIDEIIHTHTLSISPSSTDLSVMEKNPNLKLSIYYNGEVKQYSK